jgi:hypothetical protein
MAKKVIVLLLVFVLISSFVHGQAGVPKELKQNIENIDLENLPGILRFILGKNKINVEIDDDGEKSVFGFKIAGNQVKDFEEGGLDNPHYIIKTSMDAVGEVLNSEDPLNTAGGLYESGDIVIEPQKVGSKIKFWFLEKLVGWFSEEEEEPSKTGPETKPKAEISEEEKTCEIECCCTVYLREWGTCGDYPKDGPRDLGGFSYEPPEDAEANGEVKGKFSPTYPFSPTGHWQCVEMMKWKFTFTASGDDCDDELDFCEKKLGDCSKYKSEAESSASSAMDECVDKAKENCKGQFTQHTDNKAISGTC